MQAPAALLLNGAAASGSPTAAPLGARAGVGSSSPVVGSPAPPHARLLGARAAAFAGGARARLASAPPEVRTAGRGGVAGGALRAAVTSRRSDLQVLAAFGDKSRAGSTAFDPDCIQVKRPLGSGSFGECFEGSLKKRGGILNSAEELPVVLKRVKRKVRGAEEMQEIELALNVYAQKVAKGAVAAFLGHVEVAPNPQGGTSRVTGHMTSGLWLMWRFEGRHTLAYYLKRRDCIPCLAEALNVEEYEVVPTVAKQILESCAALHKAGLVHRDIKPNNLVFSEVEKKFKIIDLGACADLRAGTNYVPNESILDPTYCPPEQYVLPTDAPDLAAKSFGMRAALSPLLWARYKPDRFDAYSAGLCILQLALPPLRLQSGLSRFNSDFKKCRYSLSRYRVTADLPPRSSVLLDIDNGAGWDFLEGLLRPRKISVSSQGVVTFDEDDEVMRTSAEEAMKHRYMLNAVDVMPELAEAAKARGTGRTVWQNIAAKIFDLEASIMQQATATEMQSTVVRNLKEKVEAGEADPLELKRERGVLAKMQRRLGTLQNDLAYASNMAGGSGKKKEKRGGFFNIFSDTVNVASAAAKMAAGVLREAETTVERMEARADIRAQERAEKRGFEESDRAFLLMLKEWNIDEEADFEQDVVMLVKEDPRYLEVDQGRRQQLFDAYAEGRRKKARSEEVKRIGTARVVAARAKREAQLATERAAEAEFRWLLGNLSPPMTENTRYDMISSALGTHPAFEAVNEWRRIEIFEEMRPKAAPKPVQPAVPAPAPAPHAAAPDAAAAAPPGRSKIGDDELERLRKQQAALLDQYAELENQLKGLEGKLR